MSNPSEHDITELSSLDLLVKQIAAEIKPGTVLALQGELGAGKTTFSQHLLKELGITESVTSPTFTITNQYQTPSGQPIYHLDLYRLKNASELQQLGLDEILISPNITIIEWPELASPFLPQGTWWLQFQLDDQDKRTVFVKKG